MDFKSLDIKTVEVRSEIEVKESERSIVHYITTTDKDWGGDVVFPEGMNAEMFDKHKTVFYNHNYDRPIGSNMWHKIHENGILAKSRFAKTLFADDIFMMHKDKIINTWSIGWQPAMLNGNIKNGAVEHDRDTGITYIREWDLVEYSSAPLAMNPSALDQIKTMVKSMEAKNMIQDLEVIKELKESVQGFEAQIKQLSEAMNELKEQNTEYTELFKKDIGELTNIITKSTKQQVVETLGIPLSEHWSEKIAGEVSRKLNLK